MRKQGRRAWARPTGSKQFRLRLLGIASITAPMKTFILLLCVSALSLSTIRADDACCESKAATIQAKLQDIDLNCLVMKYEALQNAKTQAELQLVMLEAQGGAD